MRKPGFASQDRVTESGRHLLQVQIFLPPKSKFLTFAGMHLDHSLQMSPLTPTVMMLRWNR